jgi:hypothetical protein
MQQLQENAIIKRYRDQLGVQEAMNKAVLEALKTHKQAGHKVPVWHNGQVVYVDPELTRN